MEDANIVEIETVGDLLAWIDSRKGTVIHENEIPKIYGPVLMVSHDFFTTWRTEGGWWMNLTDAGNKWLKEFRGEGLPQARGSLLHGIWQIYEALRWRTAGFLTFATTKKRWSH